MQNFGLYLRWGGAGLIAFIFVQSLFFKFSNSLETQHIFGVLGEWAGLQWFADYGGYGVGTAELVASVILFTRFWSFGAVMAGGIMTGAIFFHVFTPLGIPMPVFDEAGKITGDDGGILFIMACITWCCSWGLVILDWRSEQSLLKLYLTKRGAN